jgi:hypothetical protein
MKTDTAFPPRIRRIFFENDVGACPLCGHLRGFSVPDECDENPYCPEPWDIEASLEETP